MDNEKERLLDAIEILNQEKKQILNSREYKTGNKIVKLAYNIKHFQIKNIIKKMSNRHKNKVEIKTLYSYNPRINNEPNESKLPSVTNKKIVVYTCITGNYDNILEPLYVNENVDYIIFTDIKDIKLEKWKKREIPESIKKINDNVLINRYIKMHPKEVFKDEYDYSIYIDGNIRTVSDISGFTTKVNEKTGLAIHRHYVRDCIYLEEKACILYKKGNKEKLEKQIKKYETEGMPKKFGMLECNVIVSDLSNNNAEKILNSWWDEFVKSDSRRDQLCLPYVLWKMHYKIDDIGSLGNNVYDNCKLSVETHN